MFFDLVSGFLDAGAVLMGEKVKTHPRSLASDTDCRSSSSPSARRGAMSGRARTPRVLGRRRASIPAAVPLPAHHPRFRHGTGLHPSESDGGGAPHAEGAHSY